MTYYRSVLIIVQSTVETKREKGEERKIKITKKKSHITENETVKKKEEIKNSEFVEGMEANTKEENIVKRVKIEE